MANNNKTWYEKAVFYHMYPLGMTGAPKQNIETEAESRFGELNLWIPHIKSLNCSAVYIGPLFESSTHGYDTRDYKLVDRRLGTNDDFRTFVRLCHEQEIRVVVDGVFNHTGRDFFAFRDICENRESSPYRNWYRGVDFSRNSPMGDPYGYESWHGIWELPCLNLYNQEVKNYLLDTVRFWVREFDIDGIRLDCANVLDFQFMKELRRLTDTVKPAFWLMGEVIHGEYSRWVNDEMLHSVTNYEMHKSIYSAHNDHNYFELAHNVRRLEAVGKKLYTFADNHDEDRIASKLLNKSHLKPLYALLFSLPGIPSLYYGGEWGLEGRRTPHSDDELRPAIDIASAGSRFCGLTEFIGRLGRIHLEEPALHGGEYKELLLTNRQYAFARLSGAGDIITAANNDDNPAVISVPFNTCMNECTDLLSGRTFKVCDGRVQIELEGNDAVILRITEG